MQMTHSIISYKDRYWVKLSNERGGYYGPFLKYEEAEEAIIKNSFRYTGYQSIHRHPADRT